MKKLLSTPLLPNNKVKTVFVSAEYPDIIKSLTEKFNLDVVEVEPNNELEPSISSHADCLFLQLDKNTVIVEENNYNKIVNFFTSKGGDLPINLNIEKEQVKSPYPDDVKLNCKVIDNRIICNKSYISSHIKDYACKNGIELIHTNQGYAACSVIVLNDNALITDDESIYQSSKTNGIDCILISKGSVKLKGHNYGFIGGTCGMLDKNLLAFTGKLKSHSDAELIISFLNKHRIKYIELTDEPLVDIGGIIPLIEND